jgi:hypothetical protein
VVDDINTGKLLGYVKGLNWVVSELNWLTDALLVDGVLFLIGFVNFLLALH